MTDTPLQDALKTHGTQAAAADALGLARRTFVDRLRAERRATPISVGDLTTDRQALTQRTAAGDLKKKYDEALREIDRLHQALDAKATLDNVVDTITIEPRAASRTSESTVCVLASDWHGEEIVGAEVGGLNRYNLTIAERRAKTFWQATLRLTQILQKDTSIKTMLLGLLGDFITGQIHEAESAEMNQMPPVLAIAKVQGWLIAGIEFLLKETTLNVVVPCHSGNHGRTSKKTRFSAENGHSLEYLMYLHLATHFRHEKRITFLIPEGYHSYVQVYDETLRLHHGHAVKYGGGVGGLTIPLNKAIAQWNKGKTATLDLLGHFHQLRDGGNFIVNGSMIGYNGFALSIKADYEKPKQALFLLDKKRGKTCTWPIVFDI